MTSILVPLGTRPEIVKLSPVVKALQLRGFEVRTVATGQHYDASLTDSFFDDLGVVPDERWHLDGDEATRVGTLLTKAFSEIAARPPDLVLLLGDTYTVPAFCHAARRYRVPVAHLEAGLRSFNPTSLEEVHRMMAAATASLHFAPTDLAAQFLQAEGVAKERVMVVGNPAIDVIASAGVPRRPFDQRRGAVVTAHRASNVDDPSRLLRLVDLVERLVAELGQVTFPVHPRTRARLEGAGLLRRLDQSGAVLLDPVPYQEMIGLVSGAKVVVTDSGGLQEEASWLGVPVVVLRRSTPRWEGVMDGTSALTGMNIDRTMEAVVRLSRPEEQVRVAETPCPYGDGRTGERVAEALADPATEELLRIEEPDFVDGPPM